MKGLKQYVKTWLEDSKIPHRDRSKALAWSEGSYWLGDHSKIVAREGSECPIYNPYLYTNEHMIVVVSPHYMPTGVQSYDIHNPTSLDRLGEDILVNLDHLYLCKNPKPTVPYNLYNPYKNLTWCHPSTLYSRGRNAI